ncbi:MAG: hypothetical protein IPL28_11100 [Chloroflexi bacterium]|nr:hypothetical protein [Chloroflexota bacterium]
MQERLASAILIEAEQLERELWQAVNTAAHDAGLNAAKFGAPQREVVQAIAHFLAQEPPAPPSYTSRFPRVPQPVKAVARPLVGRFIPPRPQPTPPPAPTPLILCGPPGTGKTTFIALLDVVLRTQFGLPDHIAPMMNKHDGRQHLVHKRTLNGRPLSLLSVSKWAELAHFYAWDVQQHRLNGRDTADFMTQVLAPMRILFTDEVEMTGYAPILPQMAHFGLLVVGTSNQSEFKQLAWEQLPPHLITFGGEDMRLGDPTEVVVTAADPAAHLFALGQAVAGEKHGRLPYRPFRHGETTYWQLDFRQAIKAPLLDNEWVHFLQMASPPLTLLLDDFALESLRTDYNGIMRLVALLDAVEQMGVGLLVRPAAGVGDEPTAVLSREALIHMKVTIQSTRGVTEEVKTRTVIGLDRCISRLGQAGHRARRSYS